MTTVTFDTLTLVQKLKLTGLKEDQAEEIVRAIVESQNNLITREALKIELMTELQPIKSELLLIKWMIGLLLGGVMSLVLKSFF